MIISSTPRICERKITNPKPICRHQTIYSLTNDSCIRIANHQIEESNQHMKLQQYKQQSIEHTIHSEKEQEIYLASTSWKRRGGNASGAEWRRRRGCGLGRLYGGDL